MSVVVTGATGPFGRHVVESLLRRGVAAADIVATGRRVETLADLAAAGVVVRAADYTDPEALKAAFEGADRLLLVSGSELGQRVAQHTNVIEAAAAAGVGLVAYTSVANAGSTTLLLAAEHQATEAVLAGSGLPHVLLRNGWYLENYTGQLAAHLAQGIVGSAGDGRISAATRADLADAAAAALTGAGAAGDVFELGGEAFTMAELAAAESAATGRTVTYTDLPAEQYAAILVGAGLPESLAAVLADVDAGIARGALSVDSGDLARLLGRPPTSMPDAVAAAVAALPERP